ncbi:MAG: gluconolaconase [Pseudonocardia sp.]|nr:gluconolaconase [Pseudonocardia sp.]
MRSSIGRVAVAAIFGLTAACGAPPLSTASSGPAPSAAVAQDLQQATLIVPDALRGKIDPEQVLIPPGWSMSAWASVPDARLAAWTPDGALLVSRPGEGQVVRLTPDGNTATSTVLLEGLTQPHGLAFDGTTLYVAESDKIRAYTYAAGAATGPRVVADGLPDAKSPELGGQYAHALKSVAVGPDHALYFSIGSSGNISADDRDATPQRASIMRIPPGGGPAEVFARGVRNGTGLALAPDGSVWTAVNNRDNIQYPFDASYGDAKETSQGEVIPEYVNDHPAEELAKLSAGRDLGWPFCNPDPDTHPGMAGTAYDYTTPPFVNDIETNPGGTKLDCASLPRIEQGIGAHSAPLGLSFTAALPAPYDQGALVGIHGSWNRTPPRAPEVSYFPWANGTLGPQRTLVGGFQDASGNRWGRPVAAVVGPDGAVYITDDQADAVYRLAPPGR